MATNQPNPPSNNPPPNLPPRYHYSLISPDEFSLWNPNTSNVQEINFNMMVYAKQKELPNGRVEIEDVDDLTLQRIVMSPDSPWADELKDMIMIGEGGTYGPAFLPHCVDLIGKASLPSLFWKLQNVQQSYEGMTNVVPQFIEKIVDPKPNIKFQGPIYKIEKTPISLEMGCYSDVLEVFHILHPMSELSLLVYRGYKDQDPASRHTTVRLVPDLEQKESVLEVGASVVVWNCRHAGRDSFMKNFKKVIEKHNPIAIVVTETRLYRPMFIRLVEKLETEMGWGVDESVGLMGGNALFWDPSRAIGKTLVADDIKCEVRMIAYIRAIGLESPSASGSGSPVI